MSRIQFTTRSGVREVRGSERIRARQIVRAIGAAPLRGYLTHLPQVMSASHLDTRESIELALMAGTGEFILRDLVSVADALLNGCLVLSSEAICFLAHVEALCEAHGWIAGPDRRWASELTAALIAQGILRRGKGWEEVRDLLAGEQIGPVVMSFSANDTFDWSELGDETRISRDTLRVPFGDGRSSLDVLRFILDWSILD